MKIGLKASFKYAKICFTDFALFHLILLMACNKLFLLIKAFTNTRYCIKIQSNNTKIQIIMGQIIFITGLHNFKYML